VSYVDKEVLKLPEGVLSYKGLYIAWDNMKQRCYNPNNKRYGNYGGRSIIVCDSWKNFSCFKVWALNHGWEDGLTIDRIDNDGNYEPNNCQFISLSENSRKDKLGKPSPMLGKQMSPKAKKKISLARLRRKEELGYINSPETRKKIAIAQVGNQNRRKKAITNVLP